MSDAIILLWLFLATGTAIVCGIVVTDRDLSGQAAATAATIGAVFAPLVWLVAIPYLSWRLIRILCVGIVEIRCSFFPRKAKLPRAEVRL